MLNFLYTEINVIGSIILLLMITNRSRSRLKNLPVDQQIFNGVMLLNLMVFIVDTGMWLVDGHAGTGLRVVNYVVTTVYYILNPMICLLWLQYTDYKIHESATGLLKRTRVYGIPIVICTIISLASPFTGWFFVIDEGNNYTRGPLFMIMAFVSISYMIYAFGIFIKDIVKSGWEANKDVNMHLLIFEVAVISAAVIQTLFFGVSIIWVSTMLACTSIYIKIQNAEISTDYLTGLYNRRRLDQHLRRRIWARNKEDLLFAIILDLNDFKKINDLYGHMEGDYALVKTAELLRQSSDKREDFIARLGGDEFIIIGERSKLEEIEQFMELIQLNIDEYNKKSQLKYTLSLSMGYSIFNESDTEDSFLRAADQKMYCNKQERKAVQQIKSMEKK